MASDLKRHRSNASSRSRSPPPKRNRSRSPSHARPCRRCRGTGRSPSRSTSDVSPRRRRRSSHNFRRSGPRSDRGSPDSDQHRDRRDGSRSARSPSHSRRRRGSDPDGQISSVRELSFVERIAVREQIEFYFSIFNLPLDKHLLELVGASQNIPVPLKSILQFKRVQKFKDAYKDVVEALRKSEALVVELAEGKSSGDETVKRAMRLSNKFHPTDIISNKQKLDEELNPLTIVAELHREHNHPRHQEQLEEYFKGFGAEMVRMDRQQGKHGFRTTGNVFVTWADEDLVQEFLQKTDRPDFRGRPLKDIYPKSDFDEKRGRKKAGKKTGDKTAETTEKAIGKTTEETTERAGGETTEKTTEGDGNEKAGDEMEE